MKILIDVDALVPPLTGIGRYTLNLVKGLQQSQDVSNLKYLQAGRVVDSVSMENVAHTARASGRKLPFASVLRTGYQAYRTLRFAMASRAFRDYVYHGPNYNLLPFGGRSVVTIHDLSFLRYPEFHPADRVRFWSRQIHTVAGRADHIITDSLFQRQEIIELLSIEPDKVSSVYLGCESHFRPRSAAECQELLQRTGLYYKQFNLVVATLEPRKNFQRILAAFSALPTILRKRYPLVLVGDKGWLSKSVATTIEQLVEKGEAFKLGYVTDDDLPYLYSAAALFIYPSLYEGFGLPVLEAMASGTAVITSNVSSLPEVAGNACMTVGPREVDELTQAWEYLLSDEAERARLGDLGVVQATQFSWDRCVQQTLNIYRGLADG